MKKWPLHSETIPCQKNVAHPALGDESQICLFPFHIKIGLINICVKAMNKENEGSAYLRQKFPKIIEAKWKTEFSLVLKLTDEILQNEEPGRHLKMTAETL
jgi:hypothetical protein